MSRKKIYIISAVVIILSLFVIIGATSTPDSTKTTNVSDNQSAGQITSTPTQALNYVFDVSSLVGKNIDEVREVLGQPSDKLLEPNSQQAALGAEEWDNTFEKNGKELLVTFNPKTREVVDYFISTDDPSGKTKDQEQLLELGNLGQDDTRYKIEFVKVLRDPSSFTGVKVTPQ